MTTITFEVEGIPAPQGSKTAVTSGGRARVIDGSSKTGRKAHTDWRKAVHDAAADAITADVDAPLDGPLEVWLTFRFPVPASRSAVVRRTGWGWHSTKPDIDKLCRSTLDSCVTAGLIKDDSRVARLHAEAVWITDTWHGAEITVAHCTGDWA